MANLFRMQSKCANTASRLHAWLLPFPIVQLFIMKWIAACMACHTGKYSSNRHIVDQRKNSYNDSVEPNVEEECQKKTIPRKKRAHTHARIIYIIHHQQKHGKVFIPSYKLNDTHTHKLQASRQRHNIATATTTKKNVKRNNRIFV